MKSSGRKRVVLSCIACYRKKQKCNRRYPCNHCTRRRRPEDCIYHPSQASEASKTSQSETSRSEDTAPDHDAQSQDSSANDQNIRTSNRSTANENCTTAQASASLAEMFGYVEYSESNTMALVRELGLDEEDEHHDGNPEIQPESFDKIQENIRKLPGREILDYLVQYYVADVHWMDQVVYAPWFLTQYQKWWTLGRLSVVLDVEFVVLFLRICVYASQFLPSPSHMIDRIHGMAVTDIRKVCHNIAGKLATICERLEPRGTLLRVQHLSVLGLHWQCEGRINAFGDALGKAVRVGQRIGLHRGREAWKTADLHELDKEIRCRVFCNLYTWDSLLSRQLDWDPLLPCHVTADHLPRMCLTLNDGHAPDAFSERLLQTRLAYFWRMVAPHQSVGPEYEANRAEHRYDKFCSEFMPDLPPAFALTNPNYAWDEQLQRLPIQRQLLHVTVFDWICHNFRPLLLLLREPDQLNSLPIHKLDLMAAQRWTLAAAALRMLESLSKLHILLGSSHTRLPAVIMPTFEAAVVLGSMAMDVEFTPATVTSDLNIIGEYERDGHLDMLAWDKAHLTRERCLRAAQEALARLEMLAVVSNTAKAGARTLARLLARVPPIDIE